MKLPSQVKKYILQRVSYHAVYDDSILDALEYAYQSGFAGIQLAIDSPHLSFELLTEKSIKKISSFLENKKLYMTIHAPDNATSLYTHSKYLRKGLFDYWRALLDFAIRMKSPLVTIHAGTTIEFKTDTNPQIKVPPKDLVYYENIFKYNLDTLINIINNRFLLCIESYQLDKVNMKMIKPYLARQELSLCWDVAKNYADVKLEKYLMRNISHVKQIHLHDIRRQPDGIIRSHCVIGSGELDFRHYLAQTSRADIVDYCIEVRPREKAKESLDALKLIL
jgi:sugar phosphate isomerase/epimerase